MKKLTFVTMTDAKLYEYLKTYCLEVPQNEKGQLIRGDAVKLLMECQDNMAATEDRRVKVIFHKTGDPAQGNSALIGLNGRMYQAPFDAEVVLPESVVRVADLSVLHKYREAANSRRGEVAYEEYTVKLYPYTIVEFMDAEGMMTIDEKKMASELEEAHNKKKK